MKFYIVTIHLPSVSSPSQNGLTVVLTPSGAVESCKLTAQAVASIHDVHDWAERLIARMYPGVRNEIVDSIIQWEGPYLTSGLVTVLRVDVDS